jgi:putative ATPase
VYLAAAPKSNALYLAHGAAAEEALTTRAEPVPLWITTRHARSWKQLGYGRGYRSTLTTKRGVAEMDSLPDAPEDASTTGRRSEAPKPETAARLEAARRSASGREGRAAPKD